MWSSPWKSEEVISFLKQTAADHSASKIVELIGDRFGIKTSRGAVLRKANSLGLSVGSNKGAGRPLYGALAIEALDEDQCRFGHGDPGRPGFHFCCENKVPGLSYCHHHAKRSFTLGR